MSILSNSEGEFVVIKNGETTTTTYTDYNDIPQDEVQAVVSFQGTIPHSPHSVQDHEDIAALNAAFQDLTDGVDTPPATRIGDADVPHCSGMVRAVGSPNVFVNMIPWSRQGDINTPHLYPVGLFCDIHAMPIAVGSPTVFVNMVGAGRVGDSISGCTSVAAGSPNEQGLRI